MSSPLGQAPAAAAEQAATSVSSAAHARREQIQLALSCEKQHFCSGAAGGHSAAGLPSVTVASVETDPH
jgi:hypothetical protein